MDIITISDLPSKVADGIEPDVLQLMVAGVNARALRVAPCLADADPNLVAEARLVLLGTLTRWAQVGGGARTQEVAGPFSVTTDTRSVSSGYSLRPDEITQLQALCTDATGSTGRLAFSLDTLPQRSAHLPWCNLMFGATYCSCGVDIAGYPIYELDGAP